jgi:hypothetical protein
VGVKSAAVDTAEDNERHQNRPKRPMQRDEAVLPLKGFGIQSELYFLAA